MVDGSIVGKNFHDKMEILHDYLRDVRSRLRSQEFQELCECWLKNPDNLYPNFSNVALFARYLLRENRAYENQLTAQEIKEYVTLPVVYQYIYYEMCDYLLNTEDGAEAMKLLATPTRIDQDAYKIARGRFAKQLCSQRDIVKKGILQLAKKIRKSRPTESDPEPEPSEPNPDPEPDPEPEPEPSEPDPEPSEPNPDPEPSELKDPGLQETEPQEPESEADTEPETDDTASVSSYYSTPYGVPRSTASSVASVAFPPIKFGFYSSSDDEDED
jgi:hypothetical protein